MKLIVGLGNPGRGYRQSRHNVGFSLVDELARRWSLDLKRRKFDGIFDDSRYGDEPVSLLKPETYMNCSGGSVVGAVSFYQLPLNDLLVVLDDMALEPGRLRLRPDGSGGGHNGLNDIIARLGTEDFARLRIGIGSAPTAAARDYVLGKFSSEELPMMETAVSQAADAVECWIKLGIDEAMNRYNKRSCEF